MASFLDVLQAALTNEDGVIAQRALVGRVLAALGYREAPDQRRVVWEGRNAVLHIWRGTPAGDLALVGGVALDLEDVEESEGELRRKKEHPTAPVHVQRSEPAPHSLRARIAALPPEGRAEYMDAARQLRALLEARFAREAAVRAEQEARRQGQAPRRRGRGGGIPQG